MREHEIPALKGPRLSRVPLRVESSGLDVEFKALKSPMVYSDRCHKHRHARVPPRCKECLAVADHPKEDRTHKGRVHNPHLFDAREESRRSSRIKSRMAAFHHLKPADAVPDNDAAVGHSKADMASAGRALLGRAMAGDVDPLSAPKHKARVVMPATPRDMGDLGRSLLRGL